MSKSLSIRFCSREFLFFVHLCWWANTFLKALSAAWRKHWQVLQSLPWQIARAMQWLQTHGSSCTSRGSRHQAGTFWSFPRTISLYLLLLLGSVNKHWLMGQKHITSWGDKTSWCQVTCNSLWAVVAHTLCKSSPWHRAASSHCYLHVCFSPTVATSQYLINLALIDQLLGPF